MTDGEFKRAKEIKSDLAVLAAMGIEVTGSDQLQSAFEEWRKLRAEFNSL